jgi:glucose-1-phosphate thymidylyltransferase
VKGIILAGGTGTRLYPITKSISKQLIPIYDKPMIYYPLSVLMLAGIKEVLIITNEEYLKLFNKLFKNGELLGITIKYLIQDEPNGIAEAFIIGRDFIGDDSVCLILGDNVFYGQGFSPRLRNATKINKGAIIFGYYVNNPHEFGVVEFDENNNAISIEEKPITPKSNYAIPGLYFYDNSVIDKVKQLNFSKRRELEISEINKLYLDDANLKVEILGRGFAWLDTGTYDGLADATDFVKTIQKRTGLYVGCIEEIAYINDWITKETLSKTLKYLGKTEYSNYLKNLLKG